MAQFESEKDTLTKPVLIVSNTAILSAKESLPFWLMANNSGRLSLDDAWGSLLSAQFYKKPSQKQLIDHFYKLEAQGFLGATSRAKVVQAYAGLQIGRVQVHAGYKAEVFGLNDSTLSVGNLTYGNNARPLPKIVISMPDWTPTPVLGKVFSFKLYLAHGWFESDRFQSGAMLHQKAFYLRSDFLNKKLTIIAGLHHNAQWGGANSDQETEQPARLSDFARIFLGSSGGSSALPTDQNNALGNHLGSYDLSTSYSFKDFAITAYTQFIWEDKSGLTPFNWRDGLTGLSVKLHDRSGIVSGFNAELIRTSGQDAIKNNGDIRIVEPDNFFNNGIYRSGWTYNGRMIGNPMFLILNQDVASASKVKNMVNGLSLGLEGKVAQIHYTVNYMSFKNHGTFVERINPGLRLNLISTRLNYQKGANTFGLQGVLEWGNYPGNNAGIAMTYSRRLDLRKSQ